MDSTYRSDRAAALLRLDELRAQRAREVAVLPKELLSLHVARRGRIAGSAGAITSLTALLGLWQVEVVSSHGLGTIAAALAVTAAVVFVGRDCARVAARRSFPRAVASFEARGSVAARDPRAELERLSATSSREAARHLVASEEVRSLALPLVAISLLMSVVVYLVARAALSSAGGLAWLAFPLLVAGFAPLGFMAVRYARRAAGSSLQQLCDQGHDGWWALLVAGAVAWLPSAAMFMLPAFGTLLAGVVVLPRAYSWVHRVACDEHAALEAEHRALHRALASH